MVLTEPASCPPLAADELAAGVTVAGICRATDAMDGDVDDIAAVLAESFGALPDRAGELAADLHRTLGDPRIALALIRVDGVAAAVAKATSFDGFTYLSSIGTRARFRGRGLGGLATRHAVAIAGGTATHVRLPRRVQRQRPRPPAVPAARVRVRGRVAGPPARVRLWARLTWQADDPGRLAADLARRLGAESSPHDWQEQAFAILVGQRDRSRSCRGGASRRPTTRCPAAAWCSRACPAGCAKPAPAELPPLRPHRRGLGDGRARPGRGRARGVAGRRGGDPDDDVADPILGARARPRVADGLPGEQIVLLEPTTEGRIAASLVRDGEGPCALYIHPAGGLDGWLERARERGVGTSSVEAGPFGRSVLVAGGPVAGPHLLVVDAR